MRTNIGNWERLIRIWLGAVLIGLAATDIIGMWGSVGIAPVITGLIRLVPVVCHLRIQHLPCQNLKRYEIRSCSRIFHVR